jgi:acyl-CoA thioester hydrolase
MSRPDAVTRHRVGMADVDLVQVFFARMFTWMDIGFTELMDVLGHPSSALLRSGWSTPVVDAHCNYRRPVTLDDRFELHSRVIEARGSSFLVGHDFLDEQGLFARGECRHVWIATEPWHQATPLPAWLRDADHGTVDLPDTMVGALAPPAGGVDRLTANVNDGTGVDEFVRAGVVDPRGDG